MEEGDIKMQSIKTFAGIFILLLLLSQVCVQEIKAQVTNKNEIELLKNSLSKNEISNCISPFSIGNLLSYLSIGAKGNTQNAILRFLYPHATEYAKEDFSKLAEVYKKHSKAFEFSSTISLPNEIILEKSFSSDAKKFFITINFLQKDNLKEINNNSLISLSNSGTWEEHFGKSKEENLIEFNGKLKYFRDQRIEAIELPCEGGRLCTVLITIPENPTNYEVVRLFLPSFAESSKLSRDIKKLRNYLTIKNWETLITKGFTEKLIELELPEISIKSFSNLNTPLSKSGLSLAFSPPADFRGIDSRGILRITEFQHTCSFSLKPTTAVSTKSYSKTKDEKGKEISTKDKDKVKLDFPLLIIVYDKPTGKLILTAEAIQ